MVGLHRVRSVAVSSDRHDATGRPVVDYRVMADQVRIDKWLWAVRLYRSRTAATEAVAGGHVDVDGEGVKPARRVAPGALVELSGHPRVRSCRVVRPIEKRVGAAVAAGCYDVVEAVERPSGEDWLRGGVPGGRRDRGAGRPTKKERRQTDRLRGR